MGRALLCAPYFASAVLAAGAIMNAGTEARKASAAAGHRRRRHDRDPGLHRAQRALGRRGHDATATAESGEIVLNGHKSFVLDGHTADLIVVLARVAAGPVVLHRRRRCPGAHPPRAEIDGPDAQIRAARVQPRGGPPAGRGRRRRGPVCEDDDRGRGLPGQRDGRRGGPAAAGCAGLCEDAHAVRQADRFVPVDEAQAGRHAGRGGTGQVGRLLRRGLVDDGDDDAAATLHLAKACASDAYMQTAIHAIQIHGGIGFTWDNDTHLWFKRAKSSEVFLGDAKLSSRADDAEVGGSEGEQHDRDHRRFRPRRGARLAGSELEPRLRAGGMAQQADRFRLGRAALAEGAGSAASCPSALDRWSRRSSSASARSASPRPASARLAAATLLVHGTDAAEGKVPAPQPDRRGHLVPVVQRAGQRLGPGRRHDAGRVPGQSLGDQRAEGVDHQRAPCRLGAVAGAHRLERAEAPGAVVFRARHAASRASRCGRCGR